MKKIKWGGQKPAQKYDHDGSGWHGGHSHDKPVFWNGNGYGHYKRGKDDCDQCCTDTPDDNDLVGNSATPETFAVDEREVTIFDFAAGDTIDMRDLEDAPFSAGNVFSGITQDALDFVTVTETDCHIIVTDIRNQSVLVEVYDDPCDGVDITAQMVKDALEFETFIGS